MPRPIPETTTLGVLRAQLGISAKAMAKRTGVSLSAIQKIEQNGDYKITSDAARQIALAYFVDPHWLLRGRPEDGVKGIMGLPWSPDTLDAARFELGQGMDECTRNEARNCAQSLNEAYSIIFNRAVSDGHIWKILIYAEADLFEIIRKFYPADEEPLMNLLQTQKAVKAGEKLATELQSKIDDGPPLSSGNLKTLIAAGIIPQTRR